MSTFVTMLQKETCQPLNLRRIGAVSLCLLIFLSGQFRLQFQHYVAHSTAHEVLHNQQAEADACHQAVFHTGSKAACEHPAHLTATNTDCELCDCLLQLSEFSLLPIQISTLSFISCAIFDYVSPTNHSSVFGATARGPPGFLKFYC